MPDVCHATNRKMKKSHLRPRNSVSVKSNLKREFVADQVDAYVSLIDSDSESEVEAYEVAIPGILTPKIERLKVESVPQMIDLAESSADETPVIASTSSAVVKLEYLEHAEFRRSLK